MEIQSRPAHPYRSLRRSWVADESYWMECTPLLHKQLRLHNPFSGQANLSPQPRFFFVWGGCRGLPCERIFYIWQLNCKNRKFLSILSNFPQLRHLPFTTLKFTFSNLSDQISPERHEKRVLNGRIVLPSRALDLGSNVFNWGLFDRFSHNFADNWSTPFGPALDQTR